MLPEGDRELLTAYVDGEASARQRKVVARLLRRSPEARTLLRQLQDDARKLRSLPCPPLNPDFSSRVLRTIAQRGLRTPQRTPTPAAVPLWTVVTAAASVLFAVGLSSFLYFVGVLADSNRPTVAHNKPEKKKDTARDSGAAKTQSNGLVKKDADTPAPDAPNIKDNDKPDPPERIVRDPDRGGTPDNPKNPLRNPPGAVSVAPFVDVHQPDRAEVFVPALFRLQLLKLEAQRQRLRAELTHHDAHYAEVLCREGTHAFPRVEAVLKANGVRLVVDSTARVLLKNKRRSNFLFYIEDVTPQEFGRILEQLGQEDRPEPQKPPGPFAVPDANLILLRMAPEHGKKLAQFLGVDPRQVTLTGAKSPGSSANKPPQRQALVLAYTLLPPRAPSAEVKRFLEGRKPPRQGTLQVLLILRGKL